MPDNKTAPTCAQFVAFYPEAKHAHRLYRIFVNDYLSVSKFAEHYGFTIEYANALIAYGRQVDEGRGPVY